MRSLFFLIALVVLAGCANQQYAGVNYGDVTLPGGERWIIVGGKDETNVEFEVTRADGTTARYSAENANSSVVLAEMAKVQAQQLQILSELLSKIPGS
jgi:PBP1b-binding outer membrane lipoprotein LpoB